MKNRSNEIRSNEIRIRQELPIISHSQKVKTFLHNYLVALAFIPGISQGFFHPIINLGEMEIIEDFSNINSE